MLELFDNYYSKKLDKYYVVIDFNNDYVLLANIKDKSDIWQVSHNYLNNNNNFEKLLFD